MYGDFNKQTYNRQTTFHQDSFCMYIERAGMDQPSKCTDSSFSLLPLDLRGNPPQFSEETSWMGLRSACDLPAQPSSFSNGALLTSSLAMMKNRSFFESTISVSLLLRSEAEFPSNSSSKEWHHRVPAPPWLTWLPRGNPSSHPVGSSSFEPSGWHWTWTCYCVPSAAPSGAASP